MIWTDLESNRSKVILAIVEIFHSASVLVCESVEKESLDNATFTHTWATQNHQPDSFVVTHHMEI